ncbi:MAG: hypothetical protein NT074_05125 [Methanomicrobiales archaeon]|nr:hypothetical protein [Methanomicrobiales archaeon]
MELRKDLVTGIAAIVFVVVALAAAGCMAPTFPGGNKSPPMQNEAVPGGWPLLQDVTTGESFSLDELTRGPLLISFFTIACPICTAQQKEVTALTREMPGVFTPLGLDIDPNEDEVALSEHIGKNQFSGRYAVAPREITQAFLDRFGIEIITPAAAPIVLVCNGTIYKFRSGYKTKTEIRSVIAGVCGTGGPQ